MITQLKNFLNVLLLAAAICFAGCTGKDGDPGPAGTNGTNGTNGTDGVGFDEAVAYGNISVAFSGKRPTDNVSFTETQDFKYYPAGNNPANSSSVYTDSETGDLNFDVQRFISGVDNNYNDNRFSIYLTVSAGTVTYYELQSSNSIITSTKFFGISEYHYQGDGSDDTVTITNYSYDATTGKLKFNFTWVVPASSSTGNDLTMTGVVDVIVLEALNNVNNGGG